jgi:FHIPEP family
VTGEALDQVVAERWRRLLGDVGPPTIARRVDGYERAETDPGSPSPQVFIREMFVPAEPAVRRTLDLFCAGFIERGAPDGSGSGEFILLGPDTIRAQTSVSAAGLTVTDLRVGSTGPGFRSVSVILMRVTRTTRAHDIVVSIEDLGRLLDYQHDAAGSTAVAHAIVRRLEILAAAAGAEVPIVGTITRLGDDPGADAYHLLVNSESPLSFDDDLKVRDGHLVIVPADGRASAWRGGDFMLVRFGRPPARRSEGRSLAQLRMEHDLVEAGLGRGQASTAESYSSRAASVRQSSRAEQIVQYVLAGDAARAVQTYRAAAVEPGADGPLVEGIAARVGAAGEYWMVRDVLAEAMDDPGLEAVGRLARDRLEGRLDWLLGLVPDPSETSDLLIPVVTPLVFEISDVLVPFVDSKQDGGLFLEELIPAMRERILTGFGVSVPGVRARGNPGLPPGNFTIQLDEVTVLTGTALIGGSYVVRPLDDEVPEPGAELTDTHPVTGLSGLWQLTPAEDDTGEGGTERLTPPQYLIHQIDMVFRGNLSRLLGLQEVANLVEQWAQAEPDLVGSVLPDQRAVVRLTWILQYLAAERIPVTLWRAILGGIRDAGGITMPVKSLSRAARARLRTQLPGPRYGRRVLRVPAPVQEALARHSGPLPLPPGVTHEFQRWLRESAAAGGPALSLVADDEDIREAVVALTRSHYQFVTTFTEEDLATA